MGEVVQYEDTNRLAYIRGPEGIIIGLSEQLRSFHPVPLGARIEGEIPPRRQDSPGRVEAE